MADIPGWQWSATDKAVATRKGSISTVEAVEQRMDILAHQNLDKNKFFRTCRTHVHHHDARKLSHDVS